MQEMIIVLRFDNMGGHEQMFCMCSRVVLWYCSVKYIFPINHSHCHIDITFWQSDYNTYSNQCLNKPLLKNLQNKHKAILHVVPDLANI